MSAFLLGWFRLIWLFTRGHQAFVLENLALRQQLAVYKRHSKRPRLRRSDRMFWIVPVSYTHLGAVAPGASIVVYFAPNTDAGFLDAINQASTDTVNKPSVISISWGGPESSWTAQSLQSYNSALQAASAMGVTVCVACGDTGSDDGVGDGQDHVDFPASSPFSLACGGTSLSVSGGSISSEVV